MTTTTTKLQAPTKLNGFPVIASTVHPNCVTVMVTRDPRDIVVATWWPELGTSWSWGHYHHGEDAHYEALLSFEAAEKRNHLR